MGLFSGVGDSEIFSRGRYLPPGFIGALEVKRTLVKHTRKSGLGFIAECVVLESNIEEVPVGSRATWYQKMTDSSVAFPALKEFVAVLSGFYRSQVEEIERSISPHLEELLEHATDNPDDNPLIGQKIRVETVHKLTGNKRDFTQHLWEPYEEGE